MDGFHFGVAIYLKFHEVLVLKKKIKTDLSIVLQRLYLQGKEIATSTLRLNLEGSDDEPKRRTLTMPIYLALAPTCHVWHIVRKNV